MSGLLVDWRPLTRNRNFRLIVLGQLVNLIGSQLTLVAIPYQVYRDTHSSLWVGLVSLIQLPFLIAGSLVGGAYGDRFEKRRLLIWGTVVCVIIDAALAFLASLHGTHFVGLVICAAALAGVTGFTGPIRSAAIPKILGPDDLIAGYSINQVVFNTAVVVGPTLAGVLLAAFPLATCYFIDAITFGWLALMTALLDPLPPAEDIAPAALFASITNGFRYVQQQPVAKAVWYADLIAMVFGMPRALFPAMALTVYHGGPRTLGLLYAAIGVGAVLMGLLSGWVQKVRHRGRAVVIAIMIFGAAVALFGLVPVFWFGFAMLAVAGAMDVVSTILRNTILQLAISDEFRGRLSAIQMAVVTGGPRLGDIESGSVASLTSTEFSVVSGGIACVVGVALFASRHRSFWREVAN
jgi:MFS family permease